MDTVSCSQVIRRKNKVIRKPAGSRFFPVKVWVGQEANGGVRPSPRQFRCARRMPGSSKPTGRHCKREQLCVFQSPGRTPPTFCIIMGMMLAMLGMPSRPCALQLRRQTPTPFTHLARTPGALTHEANPKPTSYPKPTLNTHPDIYIYICICIYIYILNLYSIYVHGCRSLPSSLCFSFCRALESCPGRVSAP